MELICNPSFINLLRLNIKFIIAAEYPFVKWFGRSMLEINPGCAAKKPQKQKRKRETQKQRLDL